MRETRFIDQNKEKWTEFEALLDDKKKDPDQLSNLFIKITDDLSYSRTYYPNRSVRVYLNGLAQALFHNIYKNRKGKWRRFMEFWKEDLPQVVYESRREFLLSFLVFALAIGIGVLSGYNDPEFARTILGDAYVNMTETNIENGDPMAVYKEMNEVDMFLGITLNNLRVDFLTFISGLFFAIGTIGILIYNGIMIGSFQFFFIERGLFQESFLTIWTHGTLEISAIIISGAAGLALGKGLVFPGTFTRLQAFQISARRGIKLLLGVIPLTILAGFFEGFLTRHTETPDWIRLIFILLSLSFVLGYFVFYPWWLSRKGFKKPLEAFKITEDRSFSTNYRKIKSAGEIFLDTFTLYKKYLKGIIISALSIAALYSGVYYFFLPPDFLEPFQRIPSGTFNYIFEFPNWSIAKLPVLINYPDWPMLAILNVIAFSIVAFVLCFFLKKDSESNDPEYRTEFKWSQLARFFRKNSFFALFIVAIANSLLFVDHGLAVAIFVLLLPIFTLWMFVAHKENITFFSSLGRTFGLLGGSWMRPFVVFGILSFIGFVTYVLVDSPIAWLYFEVVQWNLALEGDVLTTVVTLFSTFMTIFVLGLIFPFLLISMSFVYFTLLEIQDAKSLKERIETIGERKKVYGLEVENG